MLIPRGLALVTLVTFAQACEATGPRRRWLFSASVAAHALALLSKSIVMTLPAVLVLLDMYPLGLEQAFGRLGMWAEAIEQYETLRALDPRLANDVRAVLTPENVP